MFEIINNFITNIDYINSCAKLAVKYNYVRPKLVENKYGYIKADKLRHPIIERIIDHEYIPHDIEIGNNDLKGILLYGLNASGKSCLMKTIGLSVIMAQAGLFVPATNFTFTPYTSLYTRITGEDNMFKGLSSFSLEMMEINAILKRANRTTLVIGDEVCRGTEHISGNAIVATTILKLVEKKATFIFATHLHELINLTDIKKLTNVKAYHLAVRHDVEKDMLIYDRQLQPGSGEQIYGIIVAKYIIHDRDFIDMANKIKNELMNTSESIIPNKQSRYNKEVYVSECYICKKTEELETHHIKHQKDCHKGFSIEKPHIKKNQVSNLVVLCDNCHDDVHSNKIKLDKYVIRAIRYGLYEQ